MTAGSDITVPDVRIPRTMLSDPEFGGARDGDCQRGTLVIRDGRVAALLPGPHGDTPRLVIPKLTEPHCHLDKCHSLHRLGDVGGDLAAAIDAQARDKVNWTESDLRARATQGLAEYAQAACQTVRSHIDWTDTAAPPLAWSVLPELETTVPTTQWAALTGIDQMADAGFARAVAQTVAGTRGGVLGSFVLYHDRDTIRAGLRQCFEQAQRFGLALDFHVDETLDDLDGVELIADAALDCGHDGPVLCGHAVSLMNKSAGDLARIADKLARAGIAICALPTTNLYLQGRTSGTPERRGITRLSELSEAGVTLLVGSDNVADAFCPLGQHDPLAALHLACLAAHLDPPLARYLPMITTDAQRALGLAPITVDHASVDHLALSDAPSSAALIAGQHRLTPLAAEIDARTARLERP